MTKFDGRLFLIITLTNVILKNGFCCESSSKPAPTVPKKKERDEFYHIVELKPNPNLAWMSSRYYSAFANHSLIHYCTSEWNYLAGTNFESNPAWAVDLEINYFVSHVIFHARHHERAKRFKEGHLIVTEKRPNLQRVPFNLHCSYFAGPATARQKINFRCKEWGRFVTIAIRLSKAELEMCHVSIFAELNIKKLQPNPHLAWMTSTYKIGSAHLPLINECGIGNTWTYLTSTHTQDNPAWAVDLETNYFVTNVIVNARHDERADKFKEVHLIVTETKPDLERIPFDRHCSYFGGPATARQRINFQCNEWGKFVTISLKLDDTSLEVCHVSIFADMNSKKLKPNPNLAWMSSMYERNFANLSLSNYCRGIGSQLTYLSGTSWQKTPAWAVDLETNYFVTNVIVIARHGHYADRFKGVHLIVTEKRPDLQNVPINQHCSYFDGPAAVGQRVNFQCNEWGRFVTIALKLNNENMCLEMCQISIFAELNIKKLKPNPHLAWMTSTNNIGSAYLSLINKCGIGNTQTHLSGTEVQNNPAWAVDLETNYFVTNVIVIAPHSQYAERFKAVYLIVTEKRPDLRNVPFNQYCSYFDGPAAARQRINFQCNEWGKFVTIAIDMMKTTLEMCQVSIFAERNIEKLILNPRSTFMSSTRSSHQTADKVLMGGSCGGSVHSLSSTLQEENPSWVVELHRSRMIYGVNIRSMSKASINSIFVDEERPNFKDIIVDNACRQLTRWPILTRFQFYFVDCSRFGRFVMISIISESAVLGLCQVEVSAYKSIEKLELDPSSAWMSSTYKKFSAGRAIENSCIHSDNSYLTGTKVEKNPEWMVDMQEVYSVVAVTVRVSNNTAEASKFKNVYAYVSEDKSEFPSFSDYCAFFDGGATRLMVVNFKCKAKSEGRYVILAQRTNKISVLQLCHISVYIDNGGWDQWSTWGGPCSKLCGIEIQTRSRNCLRKKCLGKNIQSRKCAIPHCSRTRHEELKPDPNFAWMSTTLGASFASLSLTGHCDSTTAYLSSTRQQNNPAWAVDLQIAYFINLVIVFASNDRIYSMKFKEAYAMTTVDKPDLKDISFLQHCAYFKGPATQHQKIYFNCHDWGRFVTIALKLVEAILELCHTEIYAEINVEKVVLNAKSTIMSSSVTSKLADNVVFKGRSCLTLDTDYLSATNLEQNPSWAVDLLRGHKMFAVNVRPQNSEGASQFGNVLVFVTEVRPNFDDIIAEYACGNFIGPATPFQHISIGCFLYGRFVMISLMSESAMLKLCHVDVFAVKSIQKAEPQLELNPNSVWMSSTYKEFSAGRALENSCIRSGYPYLTRTDLERNPQWTLDMQGVYSVVAVTVRVSNNTYGYATFQNVYVFVREKKPQSKIVSFSDYCDFFAGGATRLMMVNFECRVVSFGRYVILAQRSDSGVLQLCHIGVYIVK